MIKPRIVLHLLVFFSFLTIHAETPLSDPGIPDGEIIVYRTDREGEVSFSRQTTRILPGEGSEFYQVITRSPGQDRALLLSREDLIPRETLLRNERGNASYQTKTEIGSSPTVGPGVIFLTDMEDLSHLLRGYPFESPQTLRLAFLGQEEGPDPPEMAFLIRYRKKEKIDLQGSDYEAYRLELTMDLSGPMAVFSRLFPKTFFWYDTSPPHPLLRYQGSGGSRSSDEVVTEMAEYHSGP
jgi:hypothetical protein